MSTRIYFTAPHAEKLLPAKEAAVLHLEMLLNMETHTALVLFLVTFLKIAPIYCCNPSKEREGGCVVGRGQLRYRDGG